MDGDVFFPDENFLQEPCFEIYIPIIDDDINEANQVFVIQLSLSLVQGVLTQRAITSFRNVSLVWIVDNDRE